MSERNSRRLRRLVGAWIVAAAAAGLAVGVGSSSLASAAISADVDPAFGTGGRVEFSYFLPGSVTAGADGTTLLSGYTSGAPMLARLAADGKYDQTFGDGGFVPALVASPLVAALPNAGANALIDGDGSLLSIGGDPLGRDCDQPGGGLTVGLLRLSGSGQRVRSYYRIGVPNFRGWAGGATSEALDQSGRTIAAFHLFPCESNKLPGRSVVARFLVGGQLDSAFGLGGLVELDGESVLERVVALANGMVMVAYRVSSGGCRLLRMTDDGHLDLSFGRGGIATSPCGLHDVDATGRLLVGSKDQPLERLLSDGSSDPTFASPLSPPLSGPAAFDADGGVLVGLIGYAAGGARTIEVIRLRPDGSRDLAFGGDGALTAPTGPYSAPDQLVVAPSGRVLVSSSDSSYLRDRFRPSSALVAFLAPGVTAPHPTSPPSLLATPGVGGAQIKVGPPPGGFSGTGPSIVGYKVDGPGGPVYVRGAKGEAWLGGLVPGQLATLTARAFFANGAVGPPATATLTPLLASPGRFVAGNRRVLDTRGAAQPAAGAVTLVTVAGAAGLAPANATAAVVNVTATEAAAPGFLTAWPAGGERPTASNLNVTRAGQTVAALAVVRPGADGAIALYTQRSTHLVVDLVGWFTPGPGASGRYVPVAAPYRLGDTRRPNSPLGDVLAAGTPRLVPLAGLYPLPASGISAVVVNLTATASPPGYFQLWGDGAAPSTSNLNVGYDGQSVANLAIVPVGADGRIRLLAQHGGHAIIDVLGYFTDASGPAGGADGYFVALTPARLVDTRIDFADLPQWPGHTVEFDRSEERRVGKECA